MPVIHDLLHPALEYKAFRQLSRRRRLMLASLGVLMVAGDRTCNALGRWDGFTHPSFPMSLVASATMAIGE